MIVADCSFISLQKILPSAVALLADCGRILALVKPQFEAGKAEAGRGKGVTDEITTARVDLVHRCDLGINSRFERGDPGQLHGLEVARVDV